MLFLFYPFFGNGYLIALISLHENSGIQKFTSDFKCQNPRQVGWVSFYCLGFFNPHLIMSENPVNESNLPSPSTWLDKVTSRKDYQFTARVGSPYKEVIAQAMDDKDHNFKQYLLELIDLGKEVKEDLTSGKPSQEPITLDQAIKHVQEVGMDQGVFLARLSNHQAEIVRKTLNSRDISFEKLIQDLIEYAESQHPDRK